MSISRIWSKIHKTIRTSKLKLITSKSKLKRIWSILSKHIHMSIWFLCLKLFQLGTNHSNYLLYRTFTYLFRLSFPLLLIFFNDTTYLSDVILATTNTKISKIKIFIWLFLNVSIYCPRIREYIFFKYSIQIIYNPYTDIHIFYGSLT